MNKFIPIAGAVGIAAVAAIYWMALPPEDNDPDVISENGLHWHSTVELYVNGVRREVSPNIGVGPAFVGAPNFNRRSGMAGLHTHDPDGTVHIEAAGTVRQEDISLGTFFATWGKSFDDYGSKLNMKVNGVENNEGVDYVMQDGDRIILSFFP